jgi:cation-transporting ATPase 13A3/4/5
MCFDKTGTLTEDGLDLYGIRPASSNTAKNMIFGPIKLDVGALVESYGSKSQFDELRMDMAGSGGFASYISLLIVNLMACCHGLT